MSIKAVSIDVKKNVNLLCEIGMSQLKICRLLKISRHCRHQTRHWSSEGNNDSTNTAHHT